MENNSDSCCFNKLVECRAQTNCERCGWNPDVSRSRSAALKRHRTEATQVKKERSRQTAQG